MKERSTIEQKLERDNRSGMEAMGASVKDLKGVSQAIRDRLKNDENILDDVSKMYEKNQSLMEQTVESITQILESSAGKTICYLLLAVVFILILLVMIR
jgi:t-SNARE complex subunit (syntaxin)